MIVASILNSTAEDEVSELLLEPVCLTVERKCWSAVGMVIRVNCLSSKYVNF